MAHLDPTAINLHADQEPKRYQLKYHNIKPESFIPNGDRYVIEEIAIPDEVKFGQIWVLVQEPQIDPRNPQAPPNVENRGVFAAVVISVGNGHLLGIPDTSHLSPMEPRRLVRGPADVPMFYEPGDVLLVDRNGKGRALRLAGREVRIVNQIDCLARIDGIRLERVDNEWREVDADA